MIYPDSIIFVLHPGTVRSVNDGQIHHINSKTLISLYGVDPKKCTVHKSEVHYKAKYDSNAIHLRPRVRGDYKKHLDFLVKEHIITQSRKFGKQSRPYMLNWEKLSDL